VRVGHGYVTAVHGLKLRWRERRSRRRGFSFFFFCFLPLFSLSLNRSEKTGEGSQLSREKLGVCWWGICFLVARWSIDKGHIYIEAVVLFRKLKILINM